ncbi:MAG TPA: BON domain-containing protein [Bryobacteraceae bacterium]|nr:BON domain-containing protein [Bryobacteraceae bacterium]HWC00092.1 BON domain-containing protein [Bryobacteraceae bacterium]
MALATWACSSAPKSPDVAPAIRQSLTAAGYKDISVSQDRDKGVVTLKGHVADDNARQRAAAIASSLAQGQVVANEVALVTPGAEHASDEMNSDLDKGIEKNLDAALISASLNKQIQYSVKNGVITLTGSVNSPALRDQAARIAASVPYQRQVVNEVQIKDQKATSD